MKIDSKAKYDARFRRRGEARKPKTRLSDRGFKGTGDVLEDAGLVPGWNMPRHANDSRGYGWPQAAGPLDHGMKPNHKARAINRAPEELHTYNSLTVMQRIRRQMPITDRMIERLRPRHKAESAARSIKDAVAVGTVLAEAEKANGADA